MEKEKIVIETPRIFAGVTLLSIARCHTYCGRSEGRFFAFGVKKPVSIVVLSSHGRQAFRVSGEEVSLEQLIDETPGLKKTLEKL